MTYFDIIKLNKCFVESSCQVLCHAQFTSFRAEKITQSNFVITFSPVNHALFSSLFFSLLSQPFSSLPTGGGNLGNSRWQTSLPSVLWAPLFTKFIPSLISCAQVLPIISLGSFILSVWPDVTSFHIYKGSVSYIIHNLFWKISFLCLDFICSYSLLLWCYVVFPYFLSFLLFLACSRQC